MNSKNRSRLSSSTLKRKTKFLSFLENNLILGVPLNYRIPKNQIRSLRKRGYLETLQNEKNSILFTQFKKITFY